MMEFKEYIKP